MPDTETMTREQELVEEFKGGLDQDAVPQLAARIAKLEADYAAERAEWEKQRDSLLEDTAKALEARDAAEKSAKTAKAKVSRGDAPAKPRNLKPMGDDAASKEDVSAAIDAAIAAGKPVEIAFSDGKKELTQIPPVVADGMVWRDHALGRMLGEPVEIKGTGDTSIGIHGYALLIDGKQVAYQQRSDQLNIAPGQSVTLDNDIVF